MKHKRKFKQGFTLIELIVVMAIIAILILIAAPKFMGYTENAKMTKILNDLKVTETAAELYYMNNDDWPKQPTEYTAAQLNTWVSEFKSISSDNAVLDTNGVYSDLDWNLMQVYMKKPDNYFKYIIQKSSGNIYYANKLTTAGEQTKFAGELVADVNGVKEIIAGYANTLALMDDGTVKAWGYNYYGQLGITINSGTENPTPITDTGLANVKKLVAGGYHTFAIMNDGTVKSWGYNTYGQLGIITNSGEETPVTIPTTITGLSNVKEIVTGYAHALAIMNDGTVKAWGYNKYGQLGVATNSGTGIDNPNPETVPGLTGVKEIISGDYHTFAIMNDGTVKSWGWNVMGQLGITTNSGTFNPNQIPATVPGVTNVKSITSSFGHAFAILNDGTVKAWGSNYYGQLGIVTNIGENTPNLPVIVTGLTDVKAIVAGDYHTVALMNDGTVKAWGSNENGQLGIDTNSGTDNPNQTPVTVPGLTDVKSIVAGDYYTFAILNDGTVKAWGHNLYGQLGNTTNNGTDDPNPTPTIVTGLTD